MLIRMKTLLQAALIGAIAISLTSCGLPGALARTAGNTLNQVGGAGTALLGY